MAAPKGSYAHFPSTGPSGTVCASCIHREPVGTRSYCRKARQMTGRQGHPIDSNSPSCKYFEKKKQEPTTFREYVASLKP